MICDQCKGYIIRELAKCKGYIVHMAAYGCDRLSKEGKYCDRNELIKYALDEKKVWHSMLDFEPETDGQYLVYVKITEDWSGNYKYEQATAKWYKFKKRWFVYRPEQQILIKVLYWRELPPMPKEIKQ